MKTIGKKLTPTDAASASASASASAQPEAVLGSISDTAAPAIDPAKPPPVKPAKVSRKKAITTDDAPLTLPKGALVVMRRSGGLRFTSSQVTVQRDGRIALTTTDVAARGAKGKAKAPKLTARQVSDLRITLAKSALDQAQKKIASQSPDGYAYEIVARVGRRTHATEVFDGSIPAGLEPLVRQLSGYLA